MGLTQISFILLPLYFVCAFMPRAQLFIMRYAGVCGSAAVLIMGSFGMTTTLPPAIFFLLNFFLQILLGRSYQGWRRTLWLMMPFIIAGAFALATAFTLPVIFDTVIKVYPQKIEPGFGTSLLHFGMGNITQSLYLAVDLVFFVCVAIYLVGEGRYLIQHFNAYLTSGFLIIAVCFWQLLNKLGGVPFPDEFFHSNPGWAQLSTQTLGAVPRINGPFTEPSTLAIYLCGFVFGTGWLLLQGYRHRGLLPLFVLSLVTIAICTSTSGFVTILLGSIFVGVYALSGAAAAVMARLLRFSLPLAGAATLVMLLMPVLAPDLVRAAGEVLTATLQKGDTSSFDERTTMDADSIGMVLDTYGLGVGWGSNRPSSLIPALLSNIGVIGTMLMAAFAVSLTRRVRRARQLACSEEQRMILQGTAASVIGILLVCVISGPTIVFTDFYLTLGLLIAIVVQIELSHCDQRVRAQPIASPQAGFGSQPSAQRQGIQAVCGSSDSIKRDWT